MRLSQMKTVKWNYLALAFLIPFGGMLLLMIISQYEPFGRYSMLYSDMYHQYYPFFVEFRRALRSGQGLMYTWSVGLGMDYLGLIAYYLASPLNLLSVLVPEGWLLEFFSLLLPVRLGLAGMSFAYFLKKIFAKDDMSIAVFGGFYGLCAWALGFQWNCMWLDTFILFPLVVLGTVSLLREGKFLLYTITLFQSIFSNYYIGLFTCIFVFLFFFIYEVCRWGGWKKFFRDFGRIALFSVLAIGMTLILELPAVAALQNSQSSVNKFPTGFRLNIASSHTFLGLLDAMRQVAGNMGGAIEPNFKEGLPNVYCGIASVLLMVLYLLSGEVKLREKICAVLLLAFLNASFIIRQLDYIWHGFHFTNMIPYRFSFLYCFTVLYMAYRAWLLRRTYNTWQLLVAGILAGGILACSKELLTTESVKIFSMELNIPVYALYNLVFLLLYLLSMVYGSLEVPVGEEATEEELRQVRMIRSRQRLIARILVLSIMCAELVGTLVCFGIYFPGTGVSNYPEGTTYAESVIRYMKEREEDTPFFRAETTHSQTLNDGAINGYNGVTAFTSSANVKTTEFMKALGYSAKNTYNRYLFEESSPVSNLFLGLKYMIDRDGKEKESTFFREVNRFGEVSLYENQAYLPLGFLAEEELENVDFASDTSAFQFQNELFSAATGLPDQVWQIIPGNRLDVTGTDTEVQNVSGAGYCQYQNSKANSNITYTYTAHRDGFLCIRLDLPKRNNFYVSVNGQELYSESISLPQMLAVRDVQEGDIIEIRVVCKEGESSTMSISAAILDHDRFWQGYDVLAASTWQLTDFRSTRLEGWIICDREGLLYTSIPQNGNWTAIVDGKEAETVLAGGCMAALPLTEGEHTVVFQYRNPAFSLGWKVSAVCLVIFLALVQGYYKPDWKALRKNGKYLK